MPRHTVGNFKDVFQFTRDVASESNKNSHIVSTVAQKRARILARKNKNMFDVELFNDTYASENSHLTHPMSHSSTSELSQTTSASKNIVAVPRPKQRKLKTTNKLPPLTSKSNVTPTHTCKKIRRKSTTQRKPSLKPGTLSQIHPSNEGSTSLLNNANSRNPSTWSSVEERNQSSDASLCPEQYAYYNFMYGVMGAFCEACILIWMPKLFEVMGEAHDTTMSNIPVNESNDNNCPFSDTTCPTRKLVAGACVRCHVSACKLHSFHFSQNRAMPSKLISTDVILQPVDEVRLILSCCGCLFDTCIYSYILLQVNETDMNGFGNTSGSSVDLCRGEVEILHPPHSPLQTQLTPDSISGNERFCNRLIRFDSTKQCMVPKKSTIRFMMITVQGDEFHRLVIMLKDLASEITLHCFKDGVYICANDNSKTALLNVKLDSRDFYFYFINPGEDAQDIQITVNTENFEQYLRSIKNRNDVTAFFLDSQTPDVLSIEIYNDNRINTKNITTLAVNSDNFVFQPCNSYTAHVLMSCNLLQESMRSIKHDCKVVIFIIKNNSFAMSSQGVGGGQFLQVISPEMTKHKEVSCSGQAVGAFSMDFLTIFSRAVNTPGVFDMYMGGDGEPLLFRIKLGNYGWLRYFVGMRTIN